MHQHHGSLPQQAAESGAPRRQAREIGTQRQALADAAGFCAAQLARNPKP